METILRTTAGLLFVCIIQTGSAQTNYINHTLQQGETLSALATQYSTNVGDIMRMNAMHADTKLVYGSVIKIPSAKNVRTNTQNVKPVTQPQTGLPANVVKHTVVKGETLYSISKQYNVSVDQIKSWNRLTDNSAKLGSILIVGNSTTAETSKPATEVKRQRVETAAPSTTQLVVEPAQKKVTENKVSESITAITPGVKENSEENTDIKINAGETAITPEAQQNNQAQTIAVDNNAEPVSSLSSKNSEGYFADMFRKSRKQKHVSGISKTFKTASGWNDGKYYVLADDINPGTIVKLKADNGNSVYAKVLWNMGDLKENNGINFRISNATAAALNESSNAFNLDISY